MQVMAQLLTAGPSYDVRPRRHEEPSSLPWTKISRLWAGSRTALLTGEQSFLFRHRGILAGEWSAPVIASFRGMEVSAKIRSKMRCEFLKT
jgi:hypothetical protein